jgi:hypothetical protein
MSSQFLKSVVVLSLLCPAVAAQISAAPTLRQITAKAGYIFAGTVTGVKPVPPNQPDQVATIEITFRVEQGARGVRARQTLIIREWAGLWSAGERYQVGERVVLVLYAPSKLGLTSPVGGAMGRFMVDRAGDLALSPQQTEAFVSDPIAAPHFLPKTHLSGRELIHILRSVAKE